MPCVLVISLGCYKCSSINGSDPDCEDEFVAKREYYTPNCMAAKKSYGSYNQRSTKLRVGLYPATWCIKFSATDSKYVCIFTKELLVVVYIHAARHHTEELYHSLNDYRILNCLLALFKCKKCTGHYTLLHK